MNIGTYLKQIRIEKGYTLNDVAHKLDLSASFLSQLENMKLSPSLDSLEKLLRFYAVNLSDFFMQVEQRRYVIVRKGDETSIDVSGGAFKMIPLASKLQNNSLESYIMKFTDAAVIETAVLPKEINGERVIYVISGKVTVIIDKETPVMLNAGDSINYKSYVQCKINTDKGDHAEIMISGIPPIVL